MPTTPVPPSASTESMPRWWLLFLVYLLFVVYGSLVPLEWRPVPWDAAVARFSNIDFLDLDAGSRADWVANIVLYVPLAFLGCATLLGLRIRTHWAVLGAVLVFALCLGIAVAVEFTQIFFAPRTVSLNDLLAEGIGSAIGVLVWLLGRWRVVELGRAFAQGGRASMVAALILFFAGYLLLSLFPYDFVVSGAELQAQLANVSNAWLAGGCASWLRCAAFWLAEVLVIAPLGLLLALLYPRWPLWQLLLMGLSVGLILEPLQLLLVSGKSQGLSVLLRGGGVLLGGATARLLMTRLPVQLLADLVWRAVPWLLLPYLAGLTVLSGWWSWPWRELGAALSRLGELGWIPFYYHYWTSEPVAMMSLLSQLALYVPVGIAFWARALALPHRRTGAMLVIGAALLLALVIECGKLFAPGARPDPTNLLIAPVGAWFAFAAALWFSRALRQAAAETWVPGPAVQSPLAGFGRGLRPRLEQQPQAPLERVPEHLGLAGPMRGPAPEPAPDPLRRPQRVRATAQEFGTRIETRAIPGHPSNPPPPLAHADESAPRPARGRRYRLDQPEDAPLPEPTPLGYLYALGAGGLALTGLVLYPVWQVWLGLSLAAFAVVLWRWPWLWLLLVPVALPVLDLTPWSGRVLLSAFDLFMLTGLAVVGLRLSGIRPARLPNAWVAAGLVLLALSWVLSTALGLAPSAGGEQPLASSHPILAPWHEGKGLLWALLAVPLLRRFRRRLGSSAAARLVLAGAVVGLMASAVAVLWERLLRIGLFDLSNQFRTTGPFASMHDGGGYIGAYLAFALPLLLGWKLSAKRLWAKALGAALAALTGYVLVVTFARGAYLGAGVGVAVLVGGLMVSGLLRRWWHWLLAIALPVLAGLALLPLIVGGFAEDRLAQIDVDLESRLGHWERAVALPGGEVGAILFGAGFGRYPTLALFASNSATRPGTFEVLDEGGNAYLRLGQGQPVYLDQPVSVQPGTPYRLSARVRGASSDAKVVLFLCDKALLYSFQCVSAGLSPSAPDVWQPMDVQLATGDWGSGWIGGQVKLSIHNAGQGTVDVDDLSLRSADGRELVDNGGFESGAARWLFVTDQAQAWHIDQLLVETYVAQGLLGLVALACLLVAAVLVLWPGIRAGRVEAVAFAAALVGLFSAGMVGSVVDAPRTGMLFYLGLFSAVLLVRGPDPKRRRSERRWTRREGAGEGVGCQGTAGRAASRAEG